MNRRLFGIAPLWEMSMILYLVLLLNEHIFYFPCTLRIRSTHSFAVGKEVKTNVCVSVCSQRERETEKYELLVFWYIGTFEIWITCCIEVKCSHINRYI